MPRRRRRLRPRAERVLRRSRRPRGRLPRRQPRPRRAREAGRERLQRRRGGGGAVDARRAGRRVTRVSPAARAECGGRRRAAVPREPARPGLGLRAQRRGRVREPRADAGAARARRPQPYRARRSASSQPISSAAPRPPERGSSSRAAGCSIPARSASRATATRVPPGCCSTPAKRRAEFHRVAYAIEKTQAAMREVGLPAALAARSRRESRPRRRPVHGSTCRT